MKFGIYKDREAQSRFGLPHEKARVWYWAEIELPTRSTTGNAGWLRATTETEALDRLREAFPSIGAIKWITTAEYDRYWELQPDYKASQMPLTLYKAPHKPLTLEEVEAKRSAWARTTFPGSTPLSSLRHLEREIEEIEADIVAGKDPTEEYADALALLLDSAGQAGVGPRALIDAMAAKLLVNQGRDWTQNPDGSYAHIEPQPS